ncbi:MAG: molybdopterin molybdotransferase MoeA [Xenococcaceae cyanobacterium]
MLPALEAESIILNLVRPLQTKETIPLEAACERILATSVTSKLDFPHWDNSAMDGYAVRHEDVIDCDRDRPKILEIIEEIPAGGVPKTSVRCGQTARIFTGAMMPEGADTIVIQENTQRFGDRVKIFESPQFQQFVRYKGSFYQAGTPMLQPGIAIGAADLAVLATAQCTELTVYRRPKVAIFSTGDELVTPDRPLQPGQIVDSNQYALAAFVGKNGGVPIKLGIVPDDRDKLKAAISQAINSADLVLSTGGVSVGDYDYVEQVIEELGGKIHVRSVAIKPGKPLTVATFPNSCLYFGIPGNPVSALVSCWRFVQPALKKLSGLSENWQPSFIKARSRSKLNSDGKRETYIWGKLLLVNGEYEFELASGSQNSANLINLAQTSGLAVIPVGQNRIELGEIVEVMQVD